MIDACCNTLDDPSNKIWIANKTEDITLNFVNMITIPNKSKTLIKHTSRKCKCRFGVRKSNPTQQWNNDKCRCECKIRENMCAKKIIFGILVHVLMKMVNI